MARRKRDGPRAAIRWIGDALVLDGDTARGAPAVWRGEREPLCARVRIDEMARDWEFGVDELPLQIAASTLAGPGIVTRFATYHRRFDDTIVVVEEDVADLTLRAVIDALAHAGGEVPAGLALYLGRELVRALATADSVRLSLDPRDVDVLWSGRVHARPAARIIDDDDPTGSAREAIAAGAYRVPRDDLAWSVRVVGVILYELVAGQPPYEPETDDDFGDDVEAALGALRDQMEVGEPAPLVHESRVLAAVVERILRGGDVEAAAFALDDGLAAEPFSADDLAGMLRGLFPELRAACASEREDRLSVMPGPRVAPEKWALLDRDVPEDTAGYETVDFDGARPTLTARGEAIDPYEPAVDPIDPFDDE